MTKEIIKFSLRVDSDTYKKVQHIADDNSRSINGQLDYIIRSFIKDYEKIKGEIKIQ
jgi:hypothetical protein